MQAIILVGGYGTRLKPYSDYIPKPMFPLGNGPILEHTINWLKKYKINEIVISSSYMSKDIKEYFRNGKNIGVDITHITSKNMHLKEIRNGKNRIIIPLAYRVWNWRNLGFFW